MKPDIAEWREHGPLEPAYRYKARVDRVIDGDTFVALVDLGGDVLARWHLRIAGINAPEISTADGPAARMAFAAILNAYELIVETRKTRTTERDVRSLERYVADVWIRSTGASVAELMVDSGHARRIG